MSTMKRLKKGRPIKLSANLLAAAIKASDGTAEGIARICKCTKPTVYTWLAKYDLHAMLETRRAEYRRKTEEELIASFAERV